MIGPLQEEVEEGAEEDAGNGIDGVMGLNIESAEEKQDGKRQADEEDFLVFSLPCQPHDDGSHSNMTAGESGCRTFAGIVCNDKGLIHRTFLPSGNGQDEVAVVDIELYGIKVITDIGEDALCNLVDTNSLEIELRSCHGQEDKDKIEQEERADNDKGSALEMLVSEEEKEDSDAYEQRIITDVAHGQQLAEEGVREGLTERQRGLEAKERLFPTSKHMVEVGEDAVHLVSVGIPPGEQQELSCDAKEHGELARAETIDAPQGQREHDGLSPEPEHFGGMSQPYVGD